MTLLVLMYHRASAGRHGNAAEMLDAHFSYIARKYRCVLPGESLDRNRLNICLSFDDGYFDFYAIVFPLLKKHGLRALLAVSALFIRERADITDSIRLEACADRINLGDCSLLGGYCTWGELSEMAESGLVSIAAHGYTHRRLDDQKTNLHTEIVIPQTMLAARLGQAIESFVLPYGRFSSVVLEQVKQTYRYVFRIGGADNKNWGGPILYRVTADEMDSPETLFSKHRLASYRLKRLWNMLRGR